jgi:AcrR family transcriptional regulator
MLASAARVICDHGYSEMSVARITAGAGVSRRTFYDLFEDREDCFLAVFEEALARAGAVAREAWEGERRWHLQVRAALLALLQQLDREPAIRSLLIVDALQAGPRVQRRRAQILAELSELLHRTGSQASGTKGLPELTGEGVVGAVLGVIHARLLRARQAPMAELAGSLMGVIVLPYLGLKAAQRELAYLPPAPGRVPRRQASDPLAGLPMRITHRTLLVLKAVAVQPGASNRQLAEAAEITDQGQISKLLTRLQGLGLIENTSPGQPHGEPNVWQLTPRGASVQRAVQAAPDHPAGSAGK